ncbi:DinB superfamily protein [Lishizhenia tianjinensis]|uniref:DinB superfamily protein n=1 Tax=Lishizhenia tianjinensis TaxID=477690 RepID=A0A1I6YVI2_9FLAO|nr:DinB family protein [Lishizhenia tianjinensis]SFT54241.1 DinB superfamily protein [Lishizhenia tianjinensis]
MNSTIILQHLNETRRRSILLWKSVPEEHLLWRPDTEAMNFLEIVRHVVGADHGWLKILQGENMRNYSSPFTNRAFSTVEDELKFAAPFRAEFLDYIQNLQGQELLKKDLAHPGVAELKIRGEYILRTAYHEAVHAGQFLNYMRQLNIDRPNIWD